MKVKCKLPIRLYKKLLGYSYEYYTVHYVAVCRIVLCFVYSSYIELFIFVFIVLIFHQKQYRYAERLRSQGKLVALEEYNTCHFGGLPGMSVGGPAEHELEEVVDILKEYLYK